MRILQLDEFLRSIKQNIDTPHSLLLGAGASIESGIPSASEYLQPDILPRNMVQNICMPDGIFRCSSLKVNLYKEIFIVYF